MNNAIAVVAPAMVGSELDLLGLCTVKACYGGKLAAFAYGTGRRDIFLICSGCRCWLCSIIFFDASDVYFMWKVIGPA